MKTIPILLLASLAVVFGVARFFVPGEPLSLPGAYKDFAHLFVGGLIGAAIVSGRRDFWLIAGGLIAVELLAFGIGALRGMS